MIKFFIVVGIFMSVVLLYLSNHERKEFVDFSHYAAVIMEFDLQQINTSPLTKICVLNNKTKMILKRVVIIAITNNIAEILVRYK